MTTLRQMGAKIGSRVRFIEDPEGQWRTVKTDAELNYEHLLPWVVENRTMTDTTHEASKLLPCPFCGSLPDAGWFPGDYDICCDNCKFSISEHIVDYEGSEGQAKSAAVMRWNTRADLVQAAVAAALREAINRVSGCDRISEVQPAILDLIRKGGE